ncbi:hypothetical protein ACLK3K_03980 [Leptospira kirschneri]|nr:hypothetical protein [Leptospira kirschneri]
MNKLKLLNMQLFERYNQKNINLILTEEVYISKIDSLAKEKIVYQEGQKN